VIAYHNVQLDALGDPTRRAILLRLLKRPQAVGELAEHFPVSRPAISQHLRMLKDAGLVSGQPHGTRRVYQIDREGFLKLHAFFDQFWSTALDAFKKKVEETQ
jgi:DNA-binding transcriptional ArsR family regulator